MPSNYDNPSADAHPAQTPISAAYMPRPGVELAIVLKIALPLIAAYLAEFAMFLTTKAVVGRLGYHELAAVGLAADLTFETLVVFMGLLSVVGVLVAQAEGAGRKPEAGNAVRQGCLLALGLGMPSMVLVWHLDSLMVWTGQDARVVELAVPYLHAIAWSILPVLWFAVLRSFVAALARTTVVMVISVFAVGLNYVLTLGLVYGRFGLPELGLAGAGWATTVVSWAMFATLVIHCYRTPILRGYGLFRGRFRFKPAACREIMCLGLPVAGLVAIEAGLFMAVAILSGVLGAENLAAYEVLMGWVGLPFVIALGLAEAAMVQVAYGIGRGSPAAARQSGILSMIAGVSVLAALIVIPIGLPEAIINVFLDPADPGYEEVSALTVKLLVIVAIFQVFDGLQAIAARALRGLRDAIVPLWLAGFGYWVLGIGGGGLLTFPLGFGAHGLWWGMALGLTVTGSLLTWRFLWLSGKLTTSEALLRK